MKLSLANTLGSILLVANSTSAIPSGTARHHRIDYKKRGQCHHHQSTSGIIHAPDSKCGDPRAVATPYKTGGPNGDEMWLDCGVNTTGWIPPPITLDNIIYKNLSVVMAQRNSPFKACKPYLSMFQQHAVNNGIPTILLASIALQESRCKPDATGGAGEIGMMQVTSEKCQGDCYDANTNIGIGARYLKDMIDVNQGNLAAAMGNYNGWWAGMTEYSANDHDTCAEHNNLDYLQTVFNGYLQGVDPDAMGMGKYNNTCD